MARQGAHVAYRRPRRPLAWPPVRRLVDTLPAQFDRLLRRASWNLIDQVLSAASNFLLAFLVARRVSADAFGAFAIAFLIFTVAIGVQRALIGQPMNIRHSVDDGDTMRRSAAAASGTALSLGAAVGVLSLVSGLFLPSPLGPCLIAVGVTMPGLVLQDAYRLIFFAGRRPRAATAIDALWIFLQIVAFVPLVMAGTASSPSYVLAWGAAATLSCVLGAALLGVLPQCGQTVRWLRANAALSGYLLAEYVLGAGAYQGGLLLIGGLVGLQDVGSLRAAQVLLGPLGIVATAAFTFLLPEVARRTTMASSSRMSVAIATSGFMLAVSIVYGGALLLMPDAIGVRLLGDTWSGARSVLLPMVVGATATACCLGPGIVIYALGRARVAFVMHMLEAPMLIALIIWGTSLAGARGAAWGMAINFLVMVPLWFWRLGRILKETPKPVPLAAETELPPAVATT